MLTDDELTTYKRHFEFMLADPYMTEDEYTEAANMGKKLLAEVGRLRAALDDIQREAGANIPASVSPHDTARSRHALERIIYLSKRALSKES